MGWIALAALTLVLTLAIRSFGFGTYVVQSNSMVPTHNIGDRLIAEKFRLTVLGLEPQRGQVVIIDRSKSEVLAANGDYVLVKRVAALGGDVITVDLDGSVSVNGDRISEPYARFGPGGASVDELVVEEDQIFLLGDNRPDSVDSRAYGPVESSAIVAIKTGAGSRC